VVGARFISLDGEGPIALPVVANSVDIGGHACTVGSIVTYWPAYAGGGIPERGVISSWNDRWVFVNYGSGPQATKREQLVWG